MTRYRADIDGLRGLSVFAVVLFHAGVPGFSGGFAGVDVFFVISGYLITSILATEIRGGSFSLVSFYERRLRRIFPALFVMMAFCAVAASLLFLPNHLRNFSRSVIAATLFVSNILFSREGGGYFDASADTKPLLHTWSLAVEEQYYIFFPIFLFLIFRRKGQWLAWLVPTAAVSLALSIWAVSLAPEAPFFLTPTRAFYLVPTRIWELLLGSLVALDAMPPLRNRWVTHGCSLIGIGLIILAVFVFSSRTPFPGLNALIPCLGTALLIYCGRDELSAAGYFLSWRPMVFAGLISYSLYLWHWPLLVFARYATIRPLNWVETAGVVAMSLAVAIASWRYVERPFRGAHAMLARPVLFRTAGAVMAVMLSFGAFANSSRGWPQRVSSEVMRLLSYEDSKNPRQSACMGSDRHPYSLDAKCVFGFAGDPEVFLWGDSHADAIIPGLAEIAEQHRAAVLFAADSACPPVDGLGTTRECLAANRAKLNAIAADGHIRTVVLSARWTSYLFGGTADFGPAELKERPIGELRDSQRVYEQFSPQARRAFADAVARTVNAVLDAGKDVAFVYPIPETGYDIPATLARLAWSGQDPAKFTRPLDYYTRRNRFIFDLLDGLGQRRQLTRIYPHQALCGGSECRVYLNDEPLYYDDNHLSLAGARLIAPLFEPIFKNKTLNAAGR